MQEYWRPVPGWESLYEVSNKGRVRSLDRTIEVLNPQGVKGPRRFKGRILVPSKGKNGYRYVSFTAPGRKREYYPVHRLVLRAFIGEPPAGCEACHADGKRGNNTLQNLRWDTRSRNALDRHRHGTMNPKRGEETHSAKLKETDVRWIRSQVGKWSIRAMARQLGVTHKTVTAVVRGESWAHVV